MYSRQESSRNSSRRAICRRSGPSPGGLEPEAYRLTEAGKQCLAAHSRFADALALPALVPTTVRDQRATIECHQPSRPQDRGRKNGTADHMTVLANGGHQQPPMTSVWPLFTSIVWWTTADRYRGSEPHPIRITYNGCIPYKVNQLYSLVNKTAKLRHSTPSPCRGRRHPVRFRVRVLRVPRCRANRSMRPTCRRTHRDPTPSTRAYGRQMAGTIAGGRDPGELSRCLWNNAHAVTYIPGGQPGHTRQPHTWSAAFRRSHRTHRSHVPTRRRRSSHGRGHGVTTGN